MHIGNTFGGEKSKYVVFVSKSTKTSLPSQNSRRRLGGSTNSRVDPGIAAAVISSSERQLCSLNLETYQIKPLLKLHKKRRHDDHHTQQQQHQFPRQSSSPSILSMTGSSASSQSISSSNSAAAALSSNSDSLSLEERLRRERQRMHSSGGLTQFTWTYSSQNSLRILVPIRGSLYVQDGIESGSHLKVVYDKHSMDKVLKKSEHIPSPMPTSAIDPQLSPDGQLFAFCVMGEIFVAPCHECHPPTQITFGATFSLI